MRRNVLLKVLAFLLSVASFTAVSISAGYQLANLDVIWGTSSPAGGYTIHYLQQQDFNGISYLLNLYYLEQEKGSLTSYDQQTKVDLEEKYAASDTNLRWQLLDPEGNVLYGNWGGERPVQPEGRYWGEYHVSNITINVRNELDTVWQEVVGSIRNPPQGGRVVQSDQWQSQLAQAVVQYWEDPGGEIDRYQVYLNADGTGDFLRIATNFGVFLYAPSVENIISPNAFGFQYDLDAGGWSQNVDGEWQEGTMALDLVLWLDTQLRVKGDDYANIYAGLEWWKAHNVGMLAATLVFVVLGLTMLSFLCAAAGYDRRHQQVYLNWFDRIPGDLVLLGAVFLGSFPANWLVDGVTQKIPYAELPMMYQLVRVGLSIAALSVLAVGLLMTFSARVKSHTLWTNTLLRRGYTWLAKVTERLKKVIPLVWRVAMGGWIYTLLSMVMLLNDGVFVWLVISAGMVVYLCSWAHCWKQIRYATGELLKGNLDVKIAYRKMPLDLREHAQQLNNLGQSIARAVAEQMRSEHFKAELITNVSHDLKTPLTSIINYVDLLKKEPIPNERVVEYLDILERKSKRLKKLTEDLVEASKASTGVLSVELGRLDMGEMVDQALGEYEERLRDAGLSVVRTLPDHPVWVWADGRRLWRVLDNLLSNCAKYTLKGSRIYLDLYQDGDYATLTVKNISREALNMPVERLMERFVRGDESRSTEGSGLGLSIAQSMTELQKGTFSVEIDGDLFKAFVSLPLAPEEETEEPPAQAEDEPRKDEI